MSFHPSQSPVDIQQIVAITNASFAGDHNTRKSCTGFFMYYGPNLVTAHSGTLSRIATSASEAELISIYVASKKMLFFRGLLEEQNALKVKTVLFTDSISFIQTLKSSVWTRYKFLGLYLHFVKEVILNLDLAIYFLKRDLNIADLLTKQNTPPIFEALWLLSQTPFKWTHGQVSSILRGGRVTVEVKSKSRNSDTVKNTVHLSWRARRKRSRSNVSRIVQNSSQPTKFKKSF